MPNQTSGGFNVGDLLGGGKGLEVLTDLIKSTFGRVTQSYFIRKDADAKAYELRQLAAAKADETRLLASAQADSIKIITSAVKEVAPGTGGITINEAGPVIQSLPAFEQDRLQYPPVLPIQERSEFRTNYREAVKQQNIESVSAIAGEQLQEENEISEEKVDPDWATRFFRHIEDISDEDMQNIWGKILAGEIKKPSSFSFRTLDVLKNLSKKEAEIFGRIASYVFEIAPNSGILCKKFIYDFGFKFGDINSMHQCGIIVYTDTAIDFSKVNNSKGEWSWLYADRILKIQNLPLSYKMDTYKLTDAGGELLQLLDIQVDSEYFQKVVDDIKQHGAQVSYSKHAPNSTGDKKYAAIHDYVQL